MYMGRACAPKSRCLQRPKEGIRYPEARVTDNNKLPSVDQALHKQHAL